MYMRFPLRDKLIALLDEFRFSQNEMLDEMERRTGISFSQPFVSKIVNDTKGKTWPNFKMIWGMSQIFDLTPDAFLPDVDLALGKQLSHVSRIMQQLSDDNRAELIQFADELKARQKDRRARNLTTIEALLSLIESNGSETAKAKAQRIVQSYFADVGESDRAEATNPK